jgi:beta-lactamase regulating signal transducer with metallopeptidase domain/Tfp pilus assembly protein PilN
VIHDVAAPLISCSIASALAILAVLLIRKSFRARFGAQLAYALWLAVPLSVVTTLLPVPVHTLRASSAATDAASSAIAVPVATVGRLVVLDLQTYGVFAWIFGVVASAAVMARQQRRFLRAMGGLSADENGTLRSDTGVGCPVLIGVLSPRIVLPADFEQEYCPDERELILAHEVTHLRSGDAQINATVAAIRCVFWFNPLVHFAATRFRIDQELACDARVVSQFPAARQTYAAAMLKSHTVEPESLFGCQWSSPNPLKERITMLTRPLPNRTRTVCGLALAVALLASGGYGAWAAQPARIVSEQRGSDADLRAELDRFAPKGVSVESVRADGTVLQIVGHAQNSADVARFVKDLGGIAWLSKVDLKSVRLDNGRMAFEIASSRSERHQGLSDNDAAELGQAFKQHLQRMAPDGVVVGDVGLSNSGGVEISGSAEDMRAVTAFVAKITSAKLFDAQSAVTTTAGSGGSVQYKIANHIEIRMSSL